MKSILLLIVLSGITHFIHAQNSISPYDHATIYLKKSGFEKDGKTNPLRHIQKAFKTRIIGFANGLCGVKNARATTIWSLSVAPLHQPF